MPISEAQMGDMLTILANLDTLHSIGSQEKLAAKTKAWLLILHDVEPEWAMQAMTTHYRDTNAKSLTPALLRFQALKVAPTPPTPYQGSSEALEARQRACSVKECRCPHTNCYAGWLDEEPGIVNRYGSYPAVARCPRCLEALKSRTMGRS